MHSTYGAALAITGESIAALDEVLASVPDSSLDWTPTSGMSSLAVLADHAVTATQFLMSASAGVKVDREAYRAGERAESFRTRGRTVAELRQRLRELEPALTAMFEGATQANLDAELPWAEDSGRRRTGVEGLFLASVHLREHVGQAQLMRDLWLSASREGH